MRVRGACGVVLVALLAGGLAAPAFPAAPAGWAVLIENDWYGGRFPALPVGYVNSTRMLGLLVRRGWPADHILLLRDDLAPDVLGRATGWLAARAHPRDVSLLYVAGEYDYFAGPLRWADAFPALWRRIPTSDRVLIIESCFAERLTTAVRGIPGIALPAVGADEWDLWGLRQTSRMIRGGAFTYFFTRVFLSQPPDASRSFSAAFREAVAQTRAYFHTAVAPVPEVLAVYHKVGAYPERLPAFPNPHLLDETAAQAAALGEAPAP